MPKVLISDELSDRAAEIFRERGVEVDVKTGLKPDELKAIIGEYDGLAIRSATKVTAEIVAAADRLKVVRSEEHTSELQSLMRISYAVFCLKKKTKTTNKDNRTPSQRNT